MSRARGRRRAATITAAAKRRLTAAEKAIRSRAYSRKEKVERKNFVGTHRTTTKDKKVQAFLEYKEQTLEKNLHLVNQIMMPVVEEAKALDAVSANTVNNFIKKINSFRSRIATAQSMEEIDQIIQEKARFEAENAVYQQAKTVSGAIDRAADLYMQEAENTIAKKRERLIEKFQRKIEHLQALLEKKEGAPVQDEKEIEKIKERIDFLTYILEDELRVDKKRSLKSIESQLSHIGHQIKAVEDRIQERDKEGVVAKKSAQDNDKKNVAILKQRKAELEKQQKEFSKKLDSLNENRRQKIEGIKADTIKKTNDFQLFHSNLPDIREGVATELKGSPYFNARNLISAMNSMRFFDVDVKKRQLELATIAESVREQKLEKQREEKQFGAEVDADVSKIMEGIYDDKPAKQSDQSQQEDSDIDNLVDSLFDSYTEKVTPQPQAKYKGHVYAEHVAAKADYLQIDKSKTEDRLYHMLKEMGRPFDIQNVQGQKKQFFGPQQTEWERDKQTAKEAIATAVNLINTYFPLPENEEERKAVLIRIAIQLSAAADPIINDLVQAMKQERSPSSLVTDEQIQKAATAAALNYLFNMGELHNYLKATDAKERSVGELLRIMTMVHHEEDVSKGFDDKFKELLFKSGSLEKLELYVGMVSADYLRELLQANPDLRAKVVATLDLFPQERNAAPYKDTLAVLYQALSNKKKKENRRPSVLTMEYSSPFGKDWQRKSGKIGGANSAGNVGGIYEKKGEDKAILALYKQDIKKGKVRVAKLIGEGLAGSLMSKAAQTVMGDEYQARIAQTELVQVRGQEKDKTGNSVYVKSTFIDGYQDDFWKVAYQERYRDYYENKLANTQEFESFERRIVDYRDKQSAALAAQMEQLRSEKSEFNIDLRNEKSANARENIKIQIENIDMKIAQLAKKASQLQTDFAAAKKALDGIRSDERVNKNPLIDFLVERKMSVMQRPSGVTSLSSRKVVSEAILNPQNNTGSKQFLRDFTAPTAIRLWLADFGVHNANKGVAKIKGEYRIVDIDFGAAFSGLKREVNPFSRTKTGIEVHKFYKNHFLEYDDAIIKSPEMAKAFIQVGKFKPEDIRQWVDASIAETLGDKFDKKALIKFAKRLGVKTKMLSKLNKENEADILAYIKNYMNERLESRSQSLLRQGFGLLLENCYDKENKVINEKALKQVMADYPEIVEFAQHEFRKMNLVLHNSNVPGKDQFLKDMLLYHVNRISANQKYNQEPVLQEPARQPTRLDPMSEASLLEVKRLLDFESQLINQYKKAEAPSYMDFQKLRLSHQGTIDTFMTYAEVDLLAGNRGLELRDRLIKYDEELLRLKVISSPMTSSLMQALPGQVQAQTVAPKAAPKVEETEAPKMRRSTTIAVQHTTNAMKRSLIRRSAPADGFKDPRNLSTTVETNKNSFFHRSSKVPASDLGPKTSPRSGAKKK